MNAAQRNPFPGGPGYRSVRKNFLGPRIRELRRSARPKVSQEDLAGRMAALGFTIDRSAISRIENQERAITDIEFIAIAQCLRIPAGDLLATPYVYHFVPGAGARVAEEPNSG